MTARKTLVEALQHLEAGDWQAAHALVQEESDLAACWAHGIVHLMESDLDNARYWYRRAGRTLAANATPAHEIVALKAHVDQESS